MALESTLKEELEKEIEAEVDAVRRRAMQQGEAMVTEAERWARQRAREEEERLARECELLSRRTLARTDLEQRNSLLRLKRQELDRVFQLAADKISEMQKSNPEEFGKLMTGVYESCRGILPEGPVRVRLGPGLEKLGESLADREGVTIETEGKFFGLVIESEQGRLYCDGTIPRLLQRLRHEREAELEEILFGEKP